MSATVPNAHDFETSDMSDKDYLEATFGEILKEALNLVVWLLPEEPIVFISSFLMQSRYKEEEGEDETGNEMPPIVHEEVANYRKFLKFNALNVNSTHNRFTLQTIKEENEDELDEYELDEAGLMVDLKKLDKNIQINEGDLELENEEQSDSDELQSDYQSDADELQNEEQSDVDEPQNEEQSDVYETEEFHFEDHQKLTSLLHEMINTEAEMKMLKLQLIYDNTRDRLLEKTKRNLAEINAVADPTVKQQKINALIKVLQGTKINEVPIIPLKNMATNDMMLHIEALIQQWETEQMEAIE